MKLAVVTGLCRPGCPGGSRPPGAVAVDLDVAAGHVRGGGEAGSLRQPRGGPRQQARSRPTATLVSRAALAPWRRFVAEPLDPSAGWVSAGQQIPAVASLIEDPGSQHGEDAAALVVTD